MREPSDKVAPGSNQQQFAIRVLDHEDGTPLSGVAVNFTLDYFGGNSKKQDQLTDKIGRATIQYSATDLKHLWRIRHKDQRPITYRFTVNGSTRS